MRDPCVWVRIARWPALLVLIGAAFLEPLGTALQITDHGGPVAVAPAEELEDRPTQLAPVQRKRRSGRRQAVEVRTEVTSVPNFEDGDGHIIISVDGVLDLFRALPDKEKLWPYPAKVAVVIALFVMFEYLLDLLSCLGSDLSSRLPRKRSLNRHSEVQETQADPATQRRLSVLTLNVWVNRARENIDKQVKNIRSLSPDVICLQEVFHLDVLEAYRTAFPDYCLVAFGRAHNLNALLALIAILLGVAAIFSGAVWFVECYITDTYWRTVWIIGVPVMLAIYSRLIRHHWTIAFLTGNRTGLALLVRRATVEITERNCVTFSRAGHAADLLNVLRPRGFISVAGLMHLPGERAPLRVRFVTTHLNQPLEQALGDGRHRQVKEVWERCYKDGELLVVGCDLNATPPGTENGSDCNTYTDVMENMQDAWLATNPSNPARDGLTWDQSENPLSVGLLNHMCYGLEVIRWRCDFVFWQYKSRSEPCGASSTQAHDMDAIIEPVKPLPAQPVVDVESCKMVFTGNEAVSDHYGVHTVFAIKDGSYQAGR